MNNLEPEEFLSDKEILGFQPLDVVDEIINSVHDSACDLVDETEEHLRPQVRPEHHEQLQKGFDEFLESWGTAVDKYCDKFELFVLKNSFNIPPALRALAAQERNRRLRIESIDTSNKENYNEQQDELDAQINLTRRQLIEVRLNLATFLLPSTPNLC